MGHHLLSLYFFSLFQRKWEAKSPRMPACVRRRLCSKGKSSQPFTSWAENISFCISQVAHFEFWDFYCEYRVRKNIRFTFSVCRYCISTHFWVCWFIFEYFYDCLKCYHEHCNIRNFHFLDCLFTRWTFRQSESDGRSTAVLRTMMSSEDLSIFFLSTRNHLLKPRNNNNHNDNHNVSSLWCVWDSIEVCVVFILYCKPAFLHSQLSQFLLPVVMLGTTGAKCLHIPVFL